MSLPAGVMDELELRYNYNYNYEFNQRDATI